MQIWNFLRGLICLQEPVEETDSKEEGLVVTLEVSEHFDHPVDHSCSQRRCDLMVLKTRLGRVKFLQLPCVRVDRSWVFGIDVDVLPFNIGSSFSWQAHTRMLIVEIVYELLNIKLTCWALHRGVTCMAMYLHETICSGRVNSLN